MTMRPVQPIPVTRQFALVHPYVLIESGPPGMPDALPRRFASLDCAAHSAAIGRATGVLHEPTGQVYDRTDCVGLAARFRPAPAALRGKEWLIR